MKTSLLFPLLLAMTASFWAAASVLAQDATAPSEAFAAGSAAFAEGDYLAALAEFQAARAFGMTGPAVHYNIAVSHFRLGEYAQAEAAFRLIAERFASMRELAEYNLGLALLRQNRAPEAIESFRRAFRSNDEAIASLADAQLRRLGAAPASAQRGMSWISLIDFKLGHDDNVVLVDESILPEDQVKDSAFGELFLYGSGAVSPSEGFRFDASAYLIRYPDAGRYDQNSLRLGGAYRWTWGEWQLDAGPHFNYSTLGGDSFERRFGAMADLRRRLGATSTFAVRLLVDEVDELDNQFSFIAGRREQLRFAFEQRRAAGRLTLAYEIERNDREDPGVSADRKRVLGRYRFPIGNAWASDVGLAYRASRFRDLPDTRTEDLLELTVGAWRMLPGGWQLGGEYGWTNNDSNVDFYSYRRNRLQMGVSRVF